MGSKKNLHARASANKRRELRLEALQRRESQILEEAEQERRREHRFDISSLETHGSLFDAEGSSRLR